MTQTVTLGRHQHRPADPPPIQGRLTLLLISLLAEHQARTAGSRDRSTVTQLARSLNQRQRRRHARRCGVPANSAARVRQARKAGR